MIKIDHVRIKKNEMIISWQDDDDFAFGQICIYLLNDEYRLDSENLSKDKVKEIFNLLIDSLELDLV